LTNSRTGPHPSWRGQIAAADRRDSAPPARLRRRHPDRHLGIASGAAVIDKGQVVHRDTIAGLKANAEIRSRYLAI
jgi:hypothetical protein